MQKIINIHQGVARMPEWRLAQPVDFQLCDGEHIAITGPNGGGKSMLVDMIIGRHPLLMQDPEYDFAPSTKPLAADNIKFITFKDNYGDTDGQYFLQLRWNQQEIDKETPVVGDLLEAAFKSSGADTPERRQMQHDLYEMFNISHLLDKYIILLSSGELRKFQLVRTLLASPRVLIMDNPFIGLDAETRLQLTQLLQTISSQQSLQVILLLSKTDDVPEFITHVVEVCNMVCGPKITRLEWQKINDLRPVAHLDNERRNAILSIPASPNDYDANEVISMRDVMVRYGERIILKGLNWQVMNGQRWALGGQNGAGKSTLLSLVCADNPQSYASDISLFGYKRGSGESIWDIKKHIGYVSPEMHRAYMRPLPAISIVASGLKDSIGLYTKPKPEEMDICRLWMHIFGLDGKEQTSFLKLSSGEQRLVLLARAFVKDPQLLILDEPLHGLDNDNRQKVKDVIETFCSRKNKTLVMVTHYQEELPPCITHHLQLLRHIDNK
ncbi:MAG: ATP-binding cassette domain-containing protein [Prevotellaceae bacterium]|nr:ATP-binding cassette domain-containing protein [Prevotellaceae bacterium]MDD6842400.1 ATP-binding cassette domain-containing protein [Prevotellaceae bacterium]